METTLTDFQRRFSEARAAADRGETVTVKAGDGAYLFARISEKPANPFADLERLFGVVTLKPDTAAPREKIRRHLRKNRTD